jgi:cell division protein FtsI (penicillin-binding protein 3)
MLDPATGEVLAMANHPSMNPNAVPGVDQELLRNRCVTDIVEPGSLFKLVTASAALEHGLVTPERKYFAENGTYILAVGAGRPQKITDTHPYGTLTFQEAVELSSNIVMAKVSRQIGAERLYTMARNYGFGTATGVDVPGEARGELKKPTQWSGTTLQSMSYGYEVAVTPLQVAAAYGALANNGVLMRPTVLKQVLDEQHQPLSTTQQQQVRRVVSPQTAQTIIRFMEGVVERGTAKSAFRAGLRLAGKTGTARKVVDGKYEGGAYVASFAGIFPADDPKVVCLVMLDRPAGGAYTGGAVSAPIVSAIAAKVTATSPRFLRNAATVQVGKRRIAVPDVTTLKVGDALAILEEQGFDAVHTGPGEVVLRQSPIAGTTVTEGETVTLGTAPQGNGVPRGYAEVPNLDGLPARRAVNRLAALGLEAAVIGSGVVADQSPRPGRPVKAGARVTLRCVPRSLSTVNLY